MKFNKTRYYNSIMFYFHYSCVSNHRYCNSTANLLMEPGVYYDGILSECGRFSKINDFIKKLLSRIIYTNNRYYLQITIQLNLVDIENTT